MSSDKERIQAVKSWCKTCTIENQNEYYKKNKNKLITSRKEWQKRNPEKIKAYKETFDKRHPGYKKEYQKKYWAKNKSIAQLSKQEEISS